MRAFPSNTPLIPMNHSHPSPYLRSGAHIQSMCQNPLPHPRASVSQLAVCSVSFPPVGGVGDVATGTMQLWDLEAWPRKGAKKEIVPSSAHVPKGGRAGHGGKASPDAWRVPWEFKCLDMLKNIPLWAGDSSLP